jgi:hypothetical protein
MLQINEAFEILSDPELRRQYDYARTHSDDARAGQRAANMAEQASKQAENYPREWDAFERWLKEALNADIQSARYGKKKTLFYGWAFPTADGSITGWLLIIGGAIAGFISSFYFVPSFRTVPGVFLGTYMEIPIPWPSRMFAAAGCLFLGAWAGRWLHSFLGYSLSAGTEATPSRPPASQSRIVACPGCSQKLRMPRIEQRIRITCSSCKHVFTQEPEQRSAPR